MSKILDKPWKKLVVVLVVFVFVALAAQQGLTAQQQTKQGSEKGDAAILGGCSESVEEINEAYTECQGEGCACGTWTKP